MYISLLALRLFLYLHLRNSLYLLTYTHILFLFNQSTLQAVNPGKVGFLKKNFCSVPSYVLRQYFRCYFAQEDHSFLGSYKQVLLDNNLDMKDEEDMRTVERAVLILLRRHSAEDRLCCVDENNQHYLKVISVDDCGFVTAVTCTNCKKGMKTTCHDVNWTYEKIYDKKLLKRGDHICWHRPYAIWHHAVVTDVEGNVRIIVHYNCLTVVEEVDLPEVGCRPGCLGEECNSLYRVNYQDCYNSEYTALRARQLLGENRYNMIERNCEHFSRWCKTGSTSSSQISMAWTSLGKVMFAIGLKAVGMLLVLGLLQFAHESQENKTRDRERLESIENILLSIYIAVMTIVFVINLVRTSCSRLGTVVRSDAADPCSKLYGNCAGAGRFTRFCCNFLCCCFSDDARRQCGDCRPNTNSRSATRCFCCLLFCTHSIIRRLCCDVCKHVQCCPCICYRRQGHLAFGLFTRIFIRELVAAVGTLAVVLHEETITNQHPIIHLRPCFRTSMLIAIASIAHIIGYIIGAFIGRLAEAVSYICCRCCCNSSATTYRTIP